MPVNHKNWIHENADVKKITEVKSTQENSSVMLTKIKNCVRACLKIPKYDKINKKIGRDLNAQLSE